MLRQATSWVVRNVFEHTVVHGDAFLVGYLFALITLCSVFGPHSFFRNWLSMLPVYAVCAAGILLMSYVDRLKRIQERQKRAKVVQDLADQGAAGSTTGGGTPALD
ncbi:hypothetical protein DIPPA_16529 [Diplonema papillatum]|nr:hypothetical protein DIPPA_16529 [Diplonema papillatum]